MTRNRIFLLVGPILSWLYCIACLTIVNRPAPVFEDDRYWPASFMVCFVFALLPLWATAALDRRLSHRRWRALVCFLAGFAMAAGLLLLLTIESGGPELMQRYAAVWWYVGPVWGLPAAICSWLVGSAPHGGDAGRIEPGNAGRD